jgi:hypothetical protein
MRGAQGAGQGTGNRRAVQPVIATALFAAAALAQAAPAAQQGSAGGVTWDVPAAWTEQAPRSMRVATYAVPAAKGHGPGECAVFFFGAGQGGGVEANVERWARQFEGNPKPERSSRQVGRWRVTEVALAGTYLAPGGPAMQSQGQLPGYRLSGAIVEGPGGSVFFKLTGPEATVAAAKGDLAALLSSLR